MNAEPTESVASSVIFGGFNQTVSAYKDRMMITNPDALVLDAGEARYEQIDDVHLYKGVLYATLTLRIRDVYRVMVRWLSRSKAVRSAALIKERVRAA
jgi:hypothetical protein